LSNLAYKYTVVVEVMVDAFAVVVQSALVYNTYLGKMKIKPQ